MSIGYTFHVRWVRGWYVRLFSRLTGQRHTIRVNLKRVFPDMPKPARRALEEKITGNVGRFYGELLNLDGFLPSLRDVKIQGPGKRSFFKAVDEKRPVILVTGHVGNYVAGLQVLRNLEIDAGFMYRTRGTRLLDRRFDRILAKLDQRGFKISHRKARRSGSNLRHFIEFLAAGNVVVMLADHRDKRGPKLDFLGVPAPTSMTPAKLAVAHDAVLIPVFVLRKGGSGRFQVVLENPVPLGDEAEMMQHFNDVIGDVIREDAAQWTWTIRRW